MATITTLNSSDTGPVSRGVINTNLANLNTDKAELNSPTFTGTPTLPTGTTAVTQSANDNSTKVATTAYVETAVAGSKARVRAYKTTTTIFSASYTKIAFDAESYDTGSNFATGTFTAPRTSYYMISANASGTATGSSTARGIGIAIYKNGSLYSQAATAKTGAISGICGAIITDVLSLTAGNTIDIYGITEATAEFTAGSGEDDTWVTIIEI